MLAAINTPVEWAQIKMKSALIVLVSSVLAKKITPDFGCVAFKCAGSAASCKFSGACSKILDCINACPDVGDDHTNLVCNVDCMTTKDEGATKQLVSLNQCLVNNKCLPIAKKIDAPAPQLDLLPIQLNSLAGTYFVEWGLNPAYDCYSCQTMSFSPVNT